MSLALLLPLVVQYGPVAVELLAALVEALRPLFADGNVPTEEEIEAVFLKLRDSHEWLQATDPDPTDG